jgi:hypothetical protein
MAAAKKAAVKPKAKPSNAATVFNSLRAKGYSSQAAAGVVGNLQQESGQGLNPKSNQVGGPGRGIAQWSEGARWETLKKYASGRKQNPEALSTQVDFMVHEMEGMGLGHTSSFAKSTSVSGATQTFETKFERAGIPNMAARIRNAQAAYTSFGKAPVTKPKPYSAVPGIHAGPKLAPKGAAPKAVPGKPGKKAGGGIPWGDIGDNLVPDNLGDIPDAVTPDHLPNPLSGVEAIGSAANKFTTTLFSVSFWIRAAFIIVGVALVFIGTKALLSGSAPAASAPSPSPSPSGGPPMQTNSAPSRPKKPFGAKVKSGVETAAVVMPK